MTRREISTSPEQTEELGRQLAETCRGRVLLLNGGLGAGKTALIRGLARALGYAGNVTSPTFAIVNDYRADGQTVLYHFDIYRLDEDGLFDLGWDDYLATGVTVAVEWADNATELMPPDAIRIELDGCGDEPRTITVTTPEP